jgi:hypothetical protein
MPGTVSGIMVGGLLSEFEGKLGYVTRVAVSWETCSR